MARGRNIATDEVRVPFMFVPRGQPAPQSHPGWVKVSASFHPRAASGQRSAERGQADMQPAPASQAAVPAERRPQMAQDEQRLNSGGSGLSQAGSGSRPERARRDDTGKPLSQGGQPVTQRGQADTHGWTPPPKLGEGGRPAAVSYAPPRQSGQTPGRMTRARAVINPPDLSASQQLLDHGGPPEKGRGGELAQLPAALDPKFFVEGAERDRQIIRKLLESTDPKLCGQFMPMAERTSSGTPKRRDEQGQP